MSYKSENWQQKLAEVRGHIPRKEGSLEKTADEIINEEIESELRLLETKEEVVEEGVILEASAGGMID